MTTKNLLIAIIGLFIFSSCAYKSKARLQEETFELQQLAFDKVIETYDDIKAYSFIDEAQDARIKIIFAATDSTFKKNKLYKKIEGTDEMIQNFKLLKRITIALSDINEENELLPDTTLAIMAEVAINMNKMLEDKYFQSISDEEKLEIDKFLKNFEHVVSTKRVKDAEQFSDELIFFYVSYWRSSVSGLRRNVLVSYIEINRRIDNLPDAIFNLPKLREVLDEPFNSDKILISMYKERMKDEFIKKGQIFDQKLQNLKKGMGMLLDLQKGRFGEEKTRKQLLDEVTEIETLIK